jgi:uncharacterized SAM-binding protein YcdF (DUF218 family)
VLPKIAGALLLPLALALELLFAAFLARFSGRRRLAGWLGAAAGLLLWIASMPFTAGSLLASMERRTPPVPVEQSPTADAIVILGGATGSRLAPRVEIELVDASDRILHAARLYRAGKAPLVVASGGRLPWSGNRVPESEEIAELLGEWGVPASAIRKEGKSSTTRENALETARLLPELHGKRVLLVTSALHMARALAAFRKAGMDVIASPADFTSVEERWTVLSFLPDSAALQGTTSAMREAIALLYYRLRGWA